MPAAALQRFTMHNPLVRGLVRVNACSLRQRPTVRLRDSHRLVYYYWDLAYTFRACLPVHHRAAHAPAEKRTSCVGFRAPLRITPPASTVYLPYILPRHFFYLNAYLIAHLLSLHLRNLRCCCCQLGHCHDWFDCL